MSDVDKPAATQPAAATQTQPSPFKTEMDKVGYAIGVNIARGMKQQIPDVNTDLLSDGIKDGVAGKPKNSTGRGGAGQSRKSCRP